MKTATAAFVLACCFAYPAKGDQWVNDTLGCTAGMIDNQCLRVVHGAPHEIAERRRRYDAKREELELIYRGRERERYHPEGVVYRENRRLDREEREREERRERERREEHRADYHSDREGADCREPLAREGTEHAEESNAKRSAMEAWAEAVRWLHGERYQQLNIARGVRMVCGQSSTAEGVINRVEASVGLIKHRCQIIAQPCKAVLERVDR